MSSINLGVAADRNLPLLRWVAGLVWLLAAALLWLSLGSYYDSAVLFRERINPRPQDLQAVTFKILKVSQRTPNFKVEFVDGTTAYLSFPDRLSFNPKAGLRTPQITDATERQLFGCPATAKIDSVPGAFGRRRQVWELDCPQWHLHYGPDVAASEIRGQTVADLLFNLFLSSVLLVTSVLCGLAAYSLSRALYGPSIPHP